MPFPMTLGLAVKNTKVFERVLNRLGGSVKVTEITSVAIAHKNLVNLLEKREPATTFVDFAYLPFFFAEGTPIPNKSAGHFGGYTFVIYGIDEEKDEVYLSDRYARPFIMSYKLLQQARNSKHAPFPVKNKLVELVIPKKINNLKDIIPLVIKSNIDFMFNPPIRNLGLKGLQKWREMLPTCGKDFSIDDLLFGLMTNFIYFETGGTGGAMFRILYRDFLKEATELLNNGGLLKASELFEKVIKKIRELESILLPDDLVNFAKLRNLCLKSGEITETAANNYQKELKKIDSEFQITIDDGQKEAPKWKDFIPKMDKKIQEWADLEESAWKIIKKAVS